MIRVLIADHHAILREGLKEILLRAFDDARCADAADAAQVLYQVRSHPWDLVILDLNLPGRSGLEVLSDLKDLRPELPVLVLSMYPEDQYARRVLTAGAVGYMNKDIAPEDFVKAVHRVLAGGRYVSATLAEMLASDLGGDAGAPIHESLSNREFEVLRMIALGKTNSQIAAELYVSPTTVSTYRARILKKMRMANNAELMRYALQNRLID